MRVHSGHLPNHHQRHSDFLVHRHDRVFAESGPGLGVPLHGDVVDNGVQPDHNHLVHALLSERRHADFLQVRPPGVPCGVPYIPCTGFRSVLTLACRLPIQVSAERSTIVLAFLPCVPSKTENGTKRSMSRHGPQCLLQVCTTARTRDHCTTCCMSFPGT